MGHRHVRVGGQRQLELRHGFVVPALSKEQEAEIVIRLHLRRLGLNGLAIQADGLADLPAPLEQYAEVVIGHPAVRVLLQRMEPEGLLVFVSQLLPPGQDTQHQQQRPAERRAKEASPSPRTGSAGILAGDV